MKAQHSRIQFLHQLKFLLWKNWLLKSRAWKSTLFEVVSPLIVILLLVLLKSVTKAQSFPDTLYENQERAVGINDSLSIGYRFTPQQHLGLFPDTPEVRTFGQTWSTFFPGAEPKYFANDQEFSAYCAAADYGNSQNPPIAIGIHFISLAGPSYQYTIRMNDSNFLLQTQDTVGPVVNPFEKGYAAGPFLTYVSGGFLSVQHYVNSYIFALETNTSIIEQLVANSVTFTPFPTPAHISDPFASIISQFVGFLMTLAFIWPVTRIIKTFVEEKESRIKETMMIMGLRAPAIWISWYLTYTVIFFLSALLIAFFSSFSLYRYSNKGIIILFFWFIGLSVISFSYMISTFFAKSKTATIFGAIIFFAFYFPVLAFNQDTSTGTKNLACLSPIIAVQLGSYNIAQLESIQEGISSGNSWREINGFKFGTALLMLLLDIFLYLVIGLYLDEVLPKEYGVKRSPIFFLKPSYWKGPAKADQEATAALQKKAPTPEQSKNIEPVGEALQSKATVQIRDLRREFPSTKGPPNVAVDSVYLDMYEGQILALLGHNGAGKTTTINMLTGLYPPSSGDAVVGGLRLSTDLDRIRQITGVCPQDNRLWDTVTVREHLAIYGGIKGLRGPDLEKEVRAIIAQVGLTEKVNAYSSSLSGGMKRKLSLGMALIGGSRVVFLDEPTSGMDPYSRRSTWDILKRMKNDRVLILTTHFMDEADYLGDRIAIMDKGQIKCCGSSLFLKSTYGVGYTMTISKGQNFDEEAVRSIVDACVQRAQVQVRGELLQNAEILTNVGGEMTFRLPFEACAQFPAMFNTFDQDLNKLGISNYGISVTTLEEVFLRVGRGENVDAVARTSARRATLEALDTDAAAADGKKIGINDDITRPVGWDRFSRHFRALLIKRWHDARRNKKAWAWTILYPFLIMLGGMGLVKLSDRQTDSPRLVMTPSLLSLASTATPDLAFNLATLPTFTTEELVEPLKSSVQTVTGTTADAKINFAQFLLRSHNDALRYGGLYFDPTLGGVGASIYVNTSALHAPPIYLSEYHNARLKQVTGKPDVSIVTASAPFPKTAAIQRYISSTVALVCAFAFAMIPASYASFLVLERETAVKHQQLISGVSPWAYWIATLAWDVANYIIPAILAIIVIAIFNIKELLGASLPAFILDCLLYGLSVTAFTYMVHFVFTNHSAAQNVMLFFFLLTGLGLLIASLVLDLIDSTKDVNSSLKYVYRLFPPYAFGEAMSNLIIKTANTRYSLALDRWDMEVVGTNFVYMTFEFIVYFAATLVIEKILATPSLLSRFSSHKEVDVDLSAEDDDVREERRRVVSGEANGDMIRLVNLRKVYPSRANQPPKIAVRDLSFGIPEGQCFGFLGINGAGKSTTLKILTADSLPTNGTAFLKGMDLMQEQERVRAHIGYCPQFDALIPTLTAKETLAMYARIKGVPENLVEGFVQQMVTMLGLSKFANEPCGGYSGGNKRKLSVGMALIGNPSIVFLDEPSTGMDPESRRFMWQVIASSMKNRSVILTTHSMEECEALCARIGIIVGGAMRCIGSSQHLKTRYGDGYQLDVHLKSKQRAEEGSVRGAESSGNGSVKPLLDSANASSGGVASESAAASPNASVAVPMSYDEQAEMEAVTKMKQWVNDTFPGSKLLEEQNGQLKFRIPKSKTSLGGLFEMMESNREALDIRDYSLSETTLEQIFIHFAGQQQEEQGGAPGVAAVQ